jgi:hypothetical protein
MLYVHCSKKPFMKKIYFIVFVLILQSCYTTQLEYLGSSSTPTQQVDVYVDEKAITRSYTIIGKGYQQANPWMSNNKAALQAAAIAAARKNGADAVFFKDEFIPSPGSQFNSNTQTKTDSTGKTTLLAATTSITPTYGYWNSQILFLKYR